MDETHENGKFSGKADQLNQNWCIGDIPSSNLNLSWISEYINSGEFLDLDDPNPIFRSDQTVNEDVNEDALLSSFNNEYQQLIEQENPPNNLTDSLIIEPILDSEGTALMLAVYLPYFISVLTQIDVDVLYERIMNMTDAFPDSEWRPKFISSIWEAGYWFIRCADELSKQWFMNVISKQQIFVDNVETRLNVVPKENLKTYQAEVLITGQIISDHKILTRFAKQNEEIDLSTSRWTDLKCAFKGKNEYKLSLEIDLLSCEKIKAKDYKLFFGMQTVNFKIFDKPEVLALDSIYTEQAAPNCSF